MIKDTPLAERMRPKTIDAFIGQEHLVGEKGILRSMLARQQLPSMIFWGPPGVGKTTLAQIMATSSGLPFFTLSAINSGVKDVREVIETARKGGKGLLFIDEIHRFNKSQQDSLLGAVEKGIITLIGATTENPSFEVIAPLLSRCQVYVLQPLDKENLQQLLKRSLKEDVLLRNRKISLVEDEALLYLSGGDARKLLNLFEMVVDAVDEPEVVLTNEIVSEIAQRKVPLYDKSGEQHYDIISAFIKSMRGSDPNAALYWMARMIAGGEDPKFIARRMLILAAEDIGNANPTALVMANNCFQAVDAIGYPECRIILSQTAIYLASSPKSKAAYTAIETALKVAKEAGDLPVPLPLRNAPTQLMKKLKYGQNYQYAHDYDHNFIAQEFLPEKISGTKIYDPGNNARENDLRDFLRFRWKEKYDY